MSQHRGFGTRIAERREHSTVARCTGCVEAQYCQPAAQWVTVQYRTEMMIYTVCDRVQSFFLFSCRGSGPRVTATRQELCAVSTMWHIFYDGLGTLSKIGKNLSRRESISSWVPEHPHHARVLLGTSHLNECIVRKNAQQPSASRSMIVQTLIATSVPRELGFLNEDQRHL